MVVKGQDGVEHRGSEGTEAARVPTDQEVCRTRETRKRFAGSSKRDWT
jgi:hypothetical protein